jgi:hypothetical protein
MRVVSASSRTVILSDMHYIVRRGSVSVKVECRVGTWQVVPEIDSRLRLLQCTKYG